MSGVSCKFCNQEFDSRNALFRHLRSSKQCFEKVTQSQAQNDQGNKNALGFVEKLDKRKLAIEFGYAVSEECCSEENTPDNPNGKPNERAASIVCKSFFRAFQKAYPSSLFIGETGDDGEPIFSLASAATLRHPSLMQENTCNALADAVGINFRGGQSNGIDFTGNLVKEMQILTNEMVVEASNSGSLSHIEILGIECLAASTNFHAEKSCTQRAYQYLVPVHWIDESTETREWIHSKLQASANSGYQEQPRDTPKSLVRFKKMLKLAESRDVTQVSSSLAGAVSSAGRYGLLWKKERRPFHNFCDPSLGSGSMASPSNENVWRSVDRCRLHSFVVDNKNDNEPFVVIELRGDGFVAQQVRRIVATVVAMSNGWLPMDFLELATRSDITIETPMAPAELLYLSAVRFHFVDLILAAPLFGATPANDRSSSWLTSLQSVLLQRRAKDLEEDNSWLNELRNHTSPRIRSVLEQQIKLAGPSTIEQTKEVVSGDATDRLIGENLPRTIAPDVYRKVLSLLHEICDSKKWPKTLDGRSRFIRSPNRVSNGTDASNFVKRKCRPVSSEFQGHLFQCGSFTVVNPKIVRGKVPGMSHQWPELAEAIFELEVHCLSKCSQDAFGWGDSGTCGMSGSTHCIVNRNAEFTPHFLNGKGKKGTHATVVGLGDYAGGKIIVDGESFDIHYEPLRFHAWSQIHSTECFTGERFSLLWFTPERREDTTTGENASFEDSHAKSLSQKHDLMLPSYPQLNFRMKSTDALVINEILDPETGCSYELSDKVWSSMIGTKHESNEIPDGFSLKGHVVVLDIGAHIGVFSRYALGVGCKKVIAYEPEFENAKLLEHNLTPLGCHESEGEKAVHSVWKCAVAHGEPGQCNFVNARNRTDGTLNSWRHSLEKYSNYVDRAGGKLVSTEQDAVLARSRVQTIPFFGNAGALHPGITFVKMDCEGAEIDILLSTEASDSRNWLDVTHLVFEWSFTKERRVTEFHKAVSNLASAGFSVVYEGQGSWWDTEANCMWPYHNDLVVFARKQNQTCNSQHAPCTSQSSAFTARESSFKAP